jgi:hypothetical protein
MIGEIIFTIGLAATVALIGFAIVVLSSRIERRQPTTALRQIFSLKRSALFSRSTPLQGWLDGPPNGCLLQREKLLHSANNYRPRDAK